MKLFFLGWCLVLLTLVSCAYRGVIVIGTGATSKEVAEVIVDGVVSAASAAESKYRPQPARSSESRPR